MLSDTVPNHILNDSCHSLYSLKTTLCSLHTTFLEKETQMGIQLLGFTGVNGHWLSGHWLVLTDLTVTVKSVSPCTAASVLGTPWGANQDEVSITAVELTFPLDQFYSWSIKTSVMRINNSDYMCIAAVARTSLWKHLFVNTWCIGASWPVCAWVTVFHRDTVSSQTSGGCS